MKKITHGCERKYNYLKDLQKSNISLTDISTISIKFEYYEIKGDYIYGRGKREEININEVFKKNNKVDLLMRLLNLGKIIFNDDSIKKNVFETYETKNEIIGKPHILVNIKEITNPIKEQIIHFFEVYGIVQDDQYDLSSFIRRILDLYCTVEIWNKVEEKNIDEDTLKELIYILYPQYRKNDKNSICAGVAANIQEKGLFKHEKNKMSMYEYFSYDFKKQSYQLLNVCNDYITLAYHQLIQIIIEKNNGYVLPKCKYCGEYLSYERSSKEYCDNDECRKRRQRERTRKCRSKTNGGKV